ncbi:hypothetical protein [Bacillus sp. 1P06AnD]|uniref:hypothetical protein n=1 Tax=Bacillus sp. 1P06AnD TaxID=3132208 RepID=UPI0039A30628
MIKPIKTKIGKSKQRVIFHDSREDVQALGKVCNELIDKVNEIIAVVNGINSKNN